MLAKLKKQNTYDSKVDNVFLIDIPADTPPSDSLYMSLVGLETSIDGKDYKVISVMQDVVTSEYYALCQELIKPEDL